MNVKDSSIFFATSIIFFMAAAIIISIALYSRHSYEPHVSELLKGSQKQITEAYTLLMNPSPFAGYTGLDGTSVVVEEPLAILNHEYKVNGAISTEYIEYLEMLLAYRMLGTELGMKTAFYFFLIAGAMALLGFISRYRKRPV